MDNFNFSFLSRVQLVNLSINDFLFLFKMLARYEYFSVTLFLRLLLQRSAEIVLPFPVSLFSLKNAFFTVKAVF